MGFLEITEQFSTYDFIKSILKSNSTLSKKFKDRNFEEYFPNLASLSLSNLPLIVIEVPTMESENITVDQNLKLKTFEIPITMINTFEARSKVRSYINALIGAIENAKDIFESNNYYDPLISFEGTDLGLIQGKTAIRSEFVLTLTAHTQK